MKISTNLASSSTSASPSNPLLNSVFMVLLTTVLPPSFPSSLKVITTEEKPSSRFEVGDGAKSAVTFKHLGFLQQRRWTFAEEFEPVLGHNIPKGLHTSFDFSCELHLSPHSFLVERFNYGSLSGVQV
ncbi:hypothetical protein HPP92_001585 [Vanilla planifolia]|uniref:Uncharacterized protein n=1 Tax=Vanilla planifolia TaxID=51239 RepID=A0A835SD08_VANPL|nr:hypothetical protein HPP92_001585 [Vanilla planifolia]